MCTPYDKKVKWTLSKKFTDKIKDHLLKDKYEIAGKILFQDHSCNKNGICNKILSEHKINKGNKDSVLTPDGIINFHTHPKSCYDRERVIFGWPSGEDMFQIINFSKRGNLLHIIFTLEGAYIINSLENINTSDNKKLEEVFKMTHSFRSKDKKLQSKLFSDFLKGIIKVNSNTEPHKIWLTMANNITTNKINKILGMKGGNNNKLFDVKLLSFNAGMNFKANYVKEDCHMKSFYDRL